MCMQWVCTYLRYVGSYSYTPMFVTVIAISVQQGRGRAALISHVSEAAAKQAPSKHEQTGNAP